MTPSLANMLLCPVSCTVIFVSAEKSRQNPSKVMNGTLYKYYLITFHVQ